MLRKALLDKEQSPDNTFDWSSTQPESPNPRAKMWEIQLELMEEEESENLSEHCP